MRRRWRRTSGRRTADRRKLGDIPALLCREDRRTEIAGEGRAQLGNIAIVTRPVRQCIGPCGALGVQQLLALGLARGLQSIDQRTADKGTCPGAA